MLSLLLLTCRRGITWTSLRVCLGWLKCMGTDDAILSNVLKCQETDVLIQTFTNRD